MEQLGDFRWRMAVYFSEIIWPILCFLLVTYSIYLLWVVFKRISRMRSLDGRAILITGCDSGFGHDLAFRCLRRRMNVFAACLTEKVVHKIMLPRYLLIRSCLWMWRAWLHWQTPLPKFKSSTLKSELWIVILWIVPCSALQWGTSRLSYWTFEAKNRFFSSIIFRIKITLKGLLKVFDKKSIDFLIKIYLIIKDFIIR